MAIAKRLTFGTEFIKGTTRENPVFRQILGMCPALAVTNSAMNGVIMGLATTFVLFSSSLLISLLRRYIPRQVRISTYIIIIATFVTVVDFTLQAIAPAAHKSMAAFISLIVVNCVILGRAEAFASQNPVVPSLGDAVGNGFGFTVGLFLLGAIREVLGNGSSLRGEPVRAQLRAVGGDDPSPRRLPLPRSAPLRVRRDPGAPSETRGEAGPGGGLSHGQTRLDLRERAA